ESYLFDRAGERERALRLVVRADRRDGISPDLERLDPLAYHRRADGSLAGRRAVHEELYRSPRIERTARFQAFRRVLQLDGDLAAWQRGLGLHRVMFEVSQAVVVGELPVLDIQAPAAIETTLGGDHSLDAFLRDRQLGGDRVRVRVDRRADIRRHTDVVAVIRPTRLHFPGDAIAWVDPLGEPGIEREHVILLRLFHEQRL